MPPIGASWRSIQKALNLNGTNDLELIKEETNPIYFEFCRELAFAPLRRVTNVSVGADTGIQMPGDLMGVIRVKDQDRDNQDYWRTTEEQRYQFDGRRKWYWKQDEIVPDFGSDVTIDNGTQTMSGITPAITAAQVGEYIRFSDEPGIYQIASTTTIAKRYRGPRISRKPYRINPLGVGSLVVTESDGTFAANDVSVHYWESPTPLWDPEQDTVLPTNRALELRIMMVLMRDHQKKTSQKRDIFAEYDDQRGGGAYWDMLNMIRETHRPMIPVGMLGNRIRYGRIR